MTEPGKGAGSSTSHSTARELPLSSYQGSADLYTPGTITTSWLLKHLRVLSLIWERTFLFYLMRRFHTPKEYSEYNYYVWSITAVKARIISEIQTSACVLSRPNLPFRLERYTRLNTWKNCNNLQLTQILFAQSALSYMPRRKEKKNMGFQLFHIL